MMIYAAVALQPDFLFTLMDGGAGGLYFGGYTFTRPCLGLEGASAVVGYNGCCCTLFVLVSGCW
jgi:hypothetical protein